MNSGMDSSLRACVRCVVLLVVHVTSLGLARDAGTDAHLVAAGVLGPVQGHVGGGEQLEQVAAVLAEHGNADTYRDADAGVGGGHPQVRRAGPEPLGDAL